MGPIYDACSRRCSWSGHIFVWSCSCCVFVSCIHSVAVLNAAFCNLKFVKVCGGWMRRHPVNNLEKLPKYGTEAMHSLMFCKHFWMRYVSGNTYTCSRNGNGTYTLLCKVNIVYVVYTSRDSI